MRDTPSLTVIEAEVTAPVTVHPVDTPGRAADLTVVHGVGRLPVIEKDSRLLLGWIGRR